MPGAGSLLNASPWEDYTENQKSASASLSGVSVTSGMDSKLENVAGVSELERMASEEMENESNCVERELVEKVRQKDWLTNLVSRSDDDAAGRKWGVAKWNARLEGCEMRR